MPATKTHSARMINENGMWLPLRLEEEKATDVDRLVGLVVKASASRVEDPEFESRLRRDFSGVESYR